MSLPRRVQGLGGPIAVATVTDFDTEDEQFGLSNMQRRTIKLLADMPDDVMVSTFYHELFHFALWDSGQHHKFDKDTVEALCDLAGSMMARLGTRP